MLRLMLELCHKIMLHTLYDVSRSHGYENTTRAHLILMTFSAVSSKSHSFHSSCPKSESTLKFWSSGNRPTKTFLFFILIGTMNTKFSIWFLSKNVASKITVFSRLQIRFLHTDILSKEYFSFTCLCAKQCGHGRVQKKDLDMFLRPAMCVLETKAKYLKYVSVDKMSSLKKILYLRDMAVRAVNIYLDSDKIIIVKKKIFMQRFRYFLTKDKNVFRFSFITAYLKCIALLIRRCCPLSAAFVLNHLFEAEWNFILNITKWTNAKHVDMWFQTVIYTKICKTNAERFEAQKL